MAIQAVSFGKTAVTKNGNEYQRTSKATKIGTGIGAAWGLLNASTTVYKAARNKMPQKFKDIYLKQPLDTEYEPEGVVLSMPSKTVILSSVSRLCIQQYNTIAADDATPAAEFLKDIQTYQSERIFRINKLPDECHTTYKEVAVCGIQAGPCENGMY